MDENHIDGLKKYFRIIESPEAYQLFCKTCKRGWELKRLKQKAGDDGGGSVHPGNVLALLNHARSHRQR